MSATSVTEHHPFRPTHVGAVTCRECIDHRDAETHYTGVVWWLGEAFEWGWGLLIIATCLWPLVHALVKP